MRWVAVALTTVAVVAAVATFALAYAAIFNHDETLGYAAYLTMWLDIIVGGAACFAWVNGGAS